MWIFAFFKLGIAWNWGEKGKTHKAGEPSGLYLASVEFGGAMHILAGIAASCLPFILTITAWAG